MANIMIPRRDVGHIIKALALTQSQAESSQDYRQGYHDALLAVAVSLGLVDLLDTGNQTNPVKLVTERRG